MALGVWHDLCVQRNAASLPPLAGSIYSPRQKAAAPAFWHLIGGALHELIASGTGISIRKTEAKALEHASIMNEPSNTRTEHDLLGDREIPAEAYWGYTPCEPSKTSP